MIKANSIVLLPLAVGYVVFKIFPLWIRRIYSWLNPLRYEKDELALRFKKISVDYSRFSQEIISQLASGTGRKNLSPETRDAIVHLKDELEGLLISSQSGDEKNE